MVTRDNDPFCRDAVVSSRLRLSPCPRSPQSSFRPRVPLRLAAARSRLTGVEPPILIVAASRAAADEFALALAVERGATFGVARTGFTELAARLAIPALARQGRSPSAPLGDEAVAARVTFDAREDGALEYFEPVAGMPGFPRALGRTLADLRMAGVGGDKPDRPRRLARSGRAAGSRDRGARKSRGCRLRDDAGDGDAGDRKQAASVSRAHSGDARCRDLFEGRGGLCAGADRRLGFDDHHNSVWRRAHAQRIRTCGTRGTCGTCGTCGACVVPFAARPVCSRTTSRRRIR